MIAPTGFPAPFVATVASPDASNREAPDSDRPALSEPVPKGVSAALSSEDLDELSAARKERHSEIEGEIDSVGSQGGQPGQQVSIVV